MSETKANGASLAELADQLSDVLAAETALLESLDLREAGGLLGKKREATASLHGAMPKEGGLPPLEGQELDDLRASLHRLCTLTEANRVAIERGLATQLQVIQAIARAVPKARASEAPIYQPDGSKAPPRPPEAYAFLSRM